MKKTVMILVVLLLSGCSLFISQGYLGKEWPGKQSDALIDAWGKPESKLVNEDGETEIMYKIFNDTCTYIFYADPDGVITRYEYESTLLGTCKPIG